VSEQVLEAYSRISELRKEVDTMRADLVAVDKVAKSLPEVPPRYVERLSVLKQRLARAQAQLDWAEDTLRMHTEQDGGAEAARATIH
jgi:uncharacterized coiled-coil DUF342 family protein